jgi:manganese transport protein
MGVHGHRGLQDLFRGATADTVRHRTPVPVLMVRDPVRAAR